MCELKTRDELAKLFLDMGYKRGAEIGVFRGDFSEILIKDNPNLKLYCIDPWQPYDANHSNRKHTRYYQEATTRLSKYNTQIIRKTSMEALKDIQDNSLDFVYIDGGHNYNDVINDIRGWDKKVKVGGIISGHDYYRRIIRGRTYGIVKAVNEFVKEKNLKLHVIPDSSPSFFWVKSHE